MPILQEFALLLIAGAVGGYIAIKLNIPTVIGYLLAGLAAGTLLDFKLLVADNSIMPLLLAIALLAIGLEWGMAALDNIISANSLKQLFAFLLTVLLLSKALSFLSLDPKIIWPISLLFASSSVFMQSFTASKSRRGSGTIIGANSVNSQSALVKYLAVFVLITLFTFNANKQIEGASLIDTLLKMVCLLAITLYIGPRIMPKLVGAMLASFDKQFTAAFVTAIMMCVLVVATKLTNSWVLAVPFVGMMFAQAYSRLDVTVASLKSNKLVVILTMLFFTYIGVSANFADILGDLPKLALFTILALIIKLVIEAVIGIVLSSQNFEKALAHGLGEVGVGEHAMAIFIVIVAVIGVAPDQRAQLQNALFLLALVGSGAIYFSQGLTDKIEAKLMSAAPGLHRKLAHGKHATGANASNPTVMVIGQGKLGGYIEQILTRIQQPIIRVQDAELDTDQLIEAGIEKCKYVIFIDEVEEQAECVAIIKALNPDAMVIFNSSLALKSKSTIGARFEVVDANFETAMAVIEKLIKYKAVQTDRSVQWLREQKISLD